MSSHPYPIHPRHLPPEAATCHLKLDASACLIYSALHSVLNAVLYSVLFFPTLPNKKGA